MYFKQFPGLRRILNDNKFKHGDRIMFKTIKDLSKSLFERFQGEIDSVALKQNLSPQIKVEFNTEKYSANVK
jgi:hypothetical protein